LVISLVLFIEDGNILGLVKANQFNGVEINMFGRNGNGAHIFKRKSINKFSLFHTESRERKIKGSPSFTSKRKNKVRKR